MCNGTEILKELLQKELKCTANSSCWCMKVATKFTHDLDREDCMSPQEMLNQVTIKISDSDRKYLEGLSDLTFTKNY